MILETGKGTKKINSYCFCSTKSRENCMMRPPFWTCGSRGPQLDQYYFPNTTRGNTSWLQWRSRGQDVHSLLADPLFVDVTWRNFKLRPSSPALTAGFVEFDLATVGPR